VKKRDKTNVTHKKGKSKKKTIPTQMKWVEENINRARRYVAHLAEYLKKKEK
jgi:hypothetical protein